MKKSSNNMAGKYSAPECVPLTLEVSGLLATSPGSTTDTYLDIKDPIWKTDGDYGLE